MRSFPCSCNRVVIDSSDFITSSQQSCFSNYSIEVIRAPFTLTASFVNLIFFSSAFNVYLEAIVDTHSEDMIII